MLMPVYEYLCKDKDSKFIAIGNFNKPKYKYIYSNHNDWCKSNYGYI